MDKDTGISQAEPLGLISRSIARVARQTQRGLTPWVQRALDHSATDGGSVTPRLGYMGVTGRRAESFVERIQRKGGDAAVWNAAPVTERVMRTDTFATGIVQRFPDISTKYERQQTEAAPASQQASMPFQGGTIQASPDTGASPQMPSFDSPSSISMSSSAPAAAPAVTFSEIRERMQRQMAETREQAGRPQPEAAKPATPPPAAPTGLPPLGPSRITPSRDGGRIRRFTHIEEVNADGSTASTSGGPRQPASVQRRPDSSTPPVQRQVTPPTVQTKADVVDAPVSSSPVVEQTPKAPPIQRTTDMTPTVQRSSERTPPLRPLPKPVTVIDAAPVETTVQREPTTSNVPPVVSAVQPASVDDVTVVPSIQRAIDSEMPLRQTPAAGTTESAPDAATEAMSVSTTPAPANIARMVETTAPTVSQPTMATTPVSTEPGVQRSIEKPATNVVQRKEEPTPEVKPSVAQTATVQRATAPEVTESAPATVQRSVEPTATAASEAAREPIVGTIQRASDEPTIVQRLAADMPLHVPAASEPATGSSEQAASAAESGAAETIQASPAGDADAATIQRMVAPETVTHAATPARSQPVVQRTDTPREAEPATPKATIVPSAPAIQRAIDEAMPLRATPAATPTTDAETNSAAAGSDSGTTAPRITPSVSQSGPSINRSISTDTPTASTVNKPASTSTNATPAATPTASPTTPQAVIQRSEPTVQRAVEANAPTTPNVQAARAEPTPTPRIEPTPTGDRTPPIARLVEPSAPSVTDLPSIQRQIEQDMPLRMKPADEVPATPTADAPSTSGPTIQRSPEASGTTSSTSGAATTARPGAPKIPPGFKPMPKPTQAVQRTTDETIARKAESGTATPSASVTPAARPSASSTPTVNRSTSDAGSQTSVSPNADAPASIQRSANVAQAMPLRQPTPTARPENPPTTSASDSTPAAPQATIQRSTLPGTQPTIRPTARPAQLPPAQPQAQPIRRRAADGPAAAATAEVTPSAPSSIQRAISQELPVRVPLRLGTEPEALQRQAEAAETSAPTQTATMVAPATTTPVLQRAVARRIETRSNNVSGTTIQRQINPRVSGRMDASAISRAVSKTQMPLLYRKPATPVPSSESVSAATTPSFDLPLVRAGVLPQTSVQRSAGEAVEAAEGITAAPARQIQRKSGDMTLRRSPTATGSRSETPASRKNITIESPVFKAQQETIQRAFNPVKKAKSAAKKVGAKIKKRFKTTTTKMETEKESTGSSEQQLDELAEKIMPIVKRMLTIERERRSGRTSNY